MKALVALLSIKWLLSECNDTTGPGQSTSNKLDKWSWLPKTTNHDAEAAWIPNAKEIEFFIPKDEPLDTKSDGCDTRDRPIDLDGVFAVSGHSKPATTGRIKTGHLR
jgi:hypothetical protein